ncbi:MAG: hypothetical protein KGL18_14390 [Burkholderiales bacterium]|nr:hypothetical protein [Burkholderiales bacterium]MDE2160039.1 hypothetical protein [Burkholderiales bacterium]MDE2504148.1 hypothetical protein [Burkholderiales bacterium]
MKIRFGGGAAVLLLGLLAACGGGGGSTAASPQAQPQALASGAITAFGSVFVGGVEYSTTQARVLDDDSGATLAAGALQVGQVVDVVHGVGSSEAAELHVDPLARGYVDAIGATTLTVMGQTVGLTSATAFSDHRACVTATTNPCTAVTSAAGLTATTGSGSSAVPGSYVTVDGYLYAAATPATSAAIVATLVSVHDVPAAGSAGAFKAEGYVSAVGASTVTIGALAVDLSTATCRVNGAASACATAFSVGNIVSAWAAAAPALPATSFSATAARLRSSLALETPGASVEVEGSVSSVGGASFVVRGISVDASALPGGTALPSVGDIVEVAGTVGGGGTTVVASSLTIVHAASSRNYAFEGVATQVAAASTGQSYLLTLLGESITVTASTRLADRSTPNWDEHDPATNPFNITTFATYLAASASQTLVVQTQTDASGRQIAQSVTIVPASTVAAVQGPVDATPPVVNSSVSGTPTTFSVAGIAISADPAAISSRGARTLGTVTAGDAVVVVGSDVAGTITVGATRSASNKVSDLGAPEQGGDDMPRSF